MYVPIAHRLVYNTFYYRQYRMIIYSTFDYIDNTGFNTHKMILKIYILSALSSNFLWPAVVSCRSGLHVEDGSQNDCSKHSNLNKRNRLYKI